MICKTLGEWFRPRFVGLVSVAALFAAQSADASLIWPSPADPNTDPSYIYPIDIKTTGSDLTYTYVATGGGSGTLAINGSSTATATANNTTAQSLTFNDSETTGHTLCGGASVPAPNGTCSATFTTYYSLTAYFTAGAFTGGTVQIGGNNPGTSATEGAYIDGDPLTSGFQAATDPNTGLPLANSGTILLGTLTAFGFEGSVDSGTAGYDHLSVDFRVNVTGGDLFALGYNIGAVKWNGRVTAGGSDPYNVADWDDVVLPFNQKSFNCTGSNCASQMDTFVVPLPGAAWLFGSGILGLVGVIRRKKRA